MFCFVQQQCSSETLIFAQEALLEILGINIINIYLYIYFLITSFVCINMLLDCIHCGYFFMCVSQPGFIVECER